MSFNKIVAYSVFAVTVTTLCGVPVHAGHKERFERHCLDFQRNIAWPQPFIERDRIASCSIFDLMAENGWSQQSTLTPFHFDAQSQQLTEVGKEKVRQILTHQPPQFRTLFVSSGKNNRQTAQRMAAVQQAASDVLPEGRLPEVRQVAIPPRGWPAEFTNSINQKYTDTIPTPRLTN